MNKKNKKKTQKHKSQIEKQIYSKYINGCISFIQDLNLPIDLQIMFSSAYGCIFLWESIPWFTSHLKNILIKKKKQWQWIKNILIITIIIINNANKIWQ